MCLRKTRAKNCNFVVPYKKLTLYTTELYLWRLKCRKCVWCISRLPSNFTLTLLKMQKLQHFHITFLKYDGVFLTFKKTWFVFDALVLTRVIPKFKMLSIKTISKPDVYYDKSKFNLDFHWCDDTLLLGLSLMGLFTSFTKKKISYNRSHWKTNSGWFSQIFHVCFQTFYL